VNDQQLAGRDQRFFVDSGLSAIRSELNLDTRKELYALGIGQLRQKLTDLKSGSFHLSSNNRLQAPINLSHLQSKGQMIAFLEEHLDITYEKH